MVSLTSNSKLAPIWLSSSKDLVGNAVPLYDNESNPFGFMIPKRLADVNPYEFSCWPHTRQWEYLGIVQLSIQDAFISLLLDWFVFDEAISMVFRHVGYGWISNRDDAPNDPHHPSHLSTDYKKRGLALQQPLPLSKKAILGEGLLQRDGRAGARPHKQSRVRGHDVRARVTIREV